jgi:hypothetical protein
VKERKEIVERKIIEKGLEGEEIKVKELQSKTGQ